MIRKLRVLQLISLVAVFLLLLPNCTIPVRSIRIPHKIQITSPIESSCNEGSRLRGIIYSVNDSFLLRYATVLIDGQQGVVLDSTGIIDIKLSPGSHELLISYVGHEDALVKNVNIDTCHITYAQIGLGTNIVFHRIGGR